jgi:hypothetical protein
MSCFHVHIETCDLPSLTKLIFSALKAMADTESGEGKQETAFDYNDVANVGLVSVRSVSKKAKSTTNNKSQHR